MATPPASWELATPVYGIRYPKPTAPARYLPDAFGHIGADLESALLADAFPPNTQFRTGTNAQRLAAPPTKDVVWIETDTGKYFIGTGTAWIPLLTAQAGKALASVFNGTGGAQTLGATNIDLGGVTFALVLPSAMDIKLSWGLQVYANNTAAVLVTEILDGGASLFAGFSAGNGSASAAGFSNTPSYTQWKKGMTAGTHTLKVAARVAGTGVITATHSPTFPTYLVAETF
jgi:hypothetical protein